MKLKRRFEDKILTIISFSHNKYQRSLLKLVNKQIMIWIKLRIAIKKILMLDKIQNDEKVIDEKGLFKIGSFYN